MEREVILTEKERFVMDSYAKTVEFLGQYMGSGYEIILHSLENLNHSVIQIVNGHYSKREIGAPITDLALKMLDNIQRDGEATALHYFNRNKNGILLKSSTIPIFGEEQRIIGLLCINFYTNVPLMEVINEFVPLCADANDSSIENFSTDVDQLIMDALEKARAKVMPDDTISTANKNKEIILHLNQVGIFQLKDGVVKVADLMKISPNTVYLHLRNFKKNEKGPVARD